MRSMKAILIYSGGLDSTTLLYDLISQGVDVDCLTFDYGQRHRREIASACEISTELGVRHDIVPLGSLTPFLESSGSSLVSDSDVPDCYYTDESAKRTVVPGRNLVMLSVAAAIAESRGITKVFYAAHSSDWSIYPDCRPEFYEAARQAIVLSSAWHPVDLVAPYIEMDKAAVVRRGVILGVPFEKTWSCYKGGDFPCGTCPTCVERLEAFEAAGFEDPTRYL